MIHPRLDILRSLDEGTTDSVVNSLSCRVHVGGRSEAGWTRPTRRGRSIPIENAKIDRVVDRGWTSVVLVVGERPVVKSEAKRGTVLSSYCREIVEHGTSPCTCMVRGDLASQVLVLVLVLVLVGS